MHIIEGKFISVFCYTNNVNPLLSFIAWTPIIFTAIIFYGGIYYWRYHYNHPFVMIALGIGLLLYFFGIMHLGDKLAQWAHCTQRHEGSVEGCILYGRDISKGIYAIYMAGWSGMFAVPMGIILILGGIVLSIGWMGVLKGIGILFLIRLLMEFTHKT